MYLELSPNRDEVPFRARVERLAQVFHSLDRRVLNDGEKFPWDPNCLMENDYKVAATMYLEEAELGRYFLALSEESGLVVLKNPTSRFGWPVNSRTAYHAGTKTELELSVLLNGRDDQHEFRLHFGGSGLPLDKVISKICSNGKLNPRRINGHWAFLLGEGILKPIFPNITEEKPANVNRLEFTALDYHSTQIQNAAESALRFLTLYKMHLGQ